MEQLQESQPCKVDTEATELLLGLSVLLFFMLLATVVLLSGLWLLHMLPQLAGPHVTGAAAA